MGRPGLESLSLLKEDMQQPAAIASWKDTFHNDETKSEKGELEHIY